LSDERVDADADADGYVDANGDFDRYRTHHLAQEHQRAYRIPPKA
jgi:hypothetical protein